MKLKFFLLLLPCFCISALFGQKGILIKAGSYQSNLIVLDGDYRYGKPSVTNNPGSYFGISFYKEKHPIMQWEYTCLYISKSCYIDSKDGCLSFWSSSQCDYDLKYVNASVYPLFHYGKKVIISGSLFFDLTYLIKSTCKGTGTFQDLMMPQPITIDISGDATHSFRRFYLSVFYMARVELKADNNCSFFVESKYSSSLYNVSKLYFQYRAHDFSIGGGLKFAF